MKRNLVFRFALLATLLAGTPLLTGCYTRVASDDGDYWGYTGRPRRHQRVITQQQVVSDTIFSKDSTQPDTVVIDDSRCRNDLGYTSGGSGETIVNNYYYDDPWYTAYPYPYRPYGGTFSITLGYDWGWFDQPYAYYPYGFYDTWYDPFWYNPYPVWPGFGFGYYGYGYGRGRGFHDGFRRGFDRAYGYDDYHDGYGSRGGYGGGVSNPNHRVGRIGGGETRTGGSSPVAGITANRNMNATATRSGVSGMQPAFTAPNNTQVSRTGSQSMQIPATSAGATSVQTGRSSMTPASRSQMTPATQTPNVQTPNVTRSAPVINNNNSAPAVAPTNSGPQRSGQPSSMQSNTGANRSMSSVSQGQTSSGRHFVVVHRNSGGGNSGVQSFGGRGNGGGGMSSGRQGRGQGGNYGGRVSGGSGGGRAPSSGRSSGGGGGSRSGGSKENGGGGGGRSR